MDLMVCIWTRTALHHTKLTSKSLTNKAWRKENDTYIHELDEARWFQIAISDTIMSSDIIFRWINTAIRSCSIVHTIQQQTNKKTISSAYMNFSRILMILMLICIWMMSTMMWTLILFLRSRCCRNEVLKCWYEWLIQIFDL